MKPSRAPIADKPAHPVPPAHRVNPAEQRLWTELSRGDNKTPKCPWCEARAERVVKVGKSFGLSCWSDHG